MYDYISITTEAETIRKLLDSPEMESYRSRIMEERKRLESISLALQLSFRTFQGAYFSNFISA